MRIFISCEKKIPHFFFIKNILHKKKGLLLFKKNSPLTLNFGISSTVCKLEFMWNVKIKKYCYIKSEKKKYLLQNKSYLIV